MNENPLGPAYEAFVAAQMRRTLEPVEAAMGMGAIQELMKEYSASALAPVHETLRHASAAIEDSIDVGMLATNGIGLLAEQSAAIAAAALPISRTLDLSAIPTGLSGIWEDALPILDYTPATEAISKALVDDWESPLSGITAELFDLSQTFAAANLVISEHVLPDYSDLWTAVDEALAASAVAPTFERTPPESSTFGSALVESVDDLDLDEVNLNESVEEAGPVSTASQYWRGRYLIVSAMSFILLSNLVRAKGDTATADLMYQTGSDLIPFLLLLLGPQDSK